MWSRWSMTWIVGVALVLGGPATQAERTPEAPKTQKEKLSGYAEWRTGSTLIVDGQRLVIGPATKLKLGKIASFDAIPLGYEVSAEGTRLPDGALLALQVEAKPNGEGLFEGDIRQATNEMESEWTEAGAVLERIDDHKVEVVGRLLETGPQPDRVRQIVRRVAPPYLSVDRLRMHVVDTKEWNAMAMGNGAIWVFTGLLKDMDDDEVAIVVGHELAHYTHEHSRREFKKAMIGQAIVLGGALATQVITDNDKATAAAAAIGMISSMIYLNKYSRGSEDQADRVGLRYAYQGGFDVRKGPRLWRRFGEKYGNTNGLLNFFVGDHSTASARVKNLEREIALNYTLRR